MASTGGHPPPAVGHPPLFNMVSFLERVRKSFKPALLIVLFFTLLALVIVLLIPKNYVSRATILPPYRVGGRTDIMAQVSGFLGGAGGDFLLPAMASPSDLYGALLKSPAVMDPVIKQFNLQQRYNSQFITGARAAFKKKMDVAITREGMVKVSYQERSPELAANIVNALVNQLDKLNRELRIWSARNYRIFVENRLEEVKQELEDSRLALVDFQDIHDFNFPEGQLELALNSAAGVQAEILKAELEMNYLTNYLSESNPRIRALRNRIKSLERKLDSLEVTKSTLLPPVKQLPELYYQYLALLREYKVNETIYEYLSQQYEQAKIEEAKDIPVIQILHKAEPQPAVFVPKRRTITVIVFVCSLVVVLLWLLLVHIYERWEKFNPEDAQRLKRTYQTFLKELRLKK